jgi:hypothetical protein
VFVNFHSGKSNSVSFFDQCDKNFDNSLSSTEFDQCFSPEIETISLNAIRKLFIQIDENHDEKISKLEYSEMSAILKKNEISDPYVQFTSKDGKTRDISREELFSSFAKSRKGVEMIDGRMSRKEEGHEIMLDEVMKENPKLGNFIRIGKWAQSTLIKRAPPNVTTQFLNGTLFNLKSLPMGRKKLKKK